MPPGPPTLSIFRTDVSARADAVGLAGGTFYTANREFEKAAQDYEQILRLDPRSWIGYINVMDVYARLGRFGEAKDVAKKAFAQKLDVPGFHHILLDIALMEDEEADSASEIKWFEGNDDEYLSPWRFRPFA